MYEPSDDTYLLADCISQYKGRCALEIGVGSGLLMQVLQENFENVAGSDIDFDALQYCKRRYDAMFLCCDAASAFSGKFDLIVTNPPYLPDDENKDMAVDGGITGIEITIDFVHSALPLLTQEGKILFVVSSLANASLLDVLAKEVGMRKKVIKERKLFYETLSVIEMSR